MKKKLPSILLKCLFLVVFNILFFVIAGQCEGGFSSATRWTAYVFIHLAYIMLWITPLFEKQTIHASLLLTAYGASLIHFAAQFVVGLIFIIIGNAGNLENNPTLAIIIHILVLAAGLAVYLTNHIFNNKTAAAVQRQQAEVDYIRGVSSRVKLLLDKFDDKDTNRLIERVYDELHGSPTRSYQHVQGLESMITAKVGALENAVRARDGETVGIVTKDLMDLIDERNRQIGMNNQYQ